jgi:alkylation response protein AidB-like acyl-CoA dehydrogenase
MADYVAPLRDIRFKLDAIAGLDEIVSLPRYEHASRDLVDQILEEAGRFAGNVIGPTNRAGDAGARLENGVVRTPDGFRDAYARFIEAGWPGVPFDPEHGGQGLPWSVSIAVQEMWTSANMAFSLCMLLNQGAIECLSAHGSPEQKATYLERMVEGRWTGTMNLTEPQAGSDLALIKTRATPADDGTWRIQGQKIYITFGEHDMVENIVHLVLARVPDAPPGTRGISCFIVPKFLVNPDGSLGRRNDLKCTGIEHKLGIHGSPTCTMQFGDQGECVGYLIGEPNKGLAYMFTMMNNARLSVGVQGLAIAERAYQQALAYALERKQGRPPGRHDIAEPMLISAHPDVRRMLFTMKCQIEGMRALIYRNAAELDRARAETDADARRRAQGFADLLTPVSKAWSTDLGVEIASIGIQVHGGMGFVEETGAAQHLRDARIAPIYEGTNGIQAIDLVARKLPHLVEAVAAWQDELQAGVRATAEAAAAGGPAAEHFPSIARALEAAVPAFADATRWILEVQATSPSEALAGATPYLRLFGTVSAAHLLGQAALAARARLEAGEGDPTFHEARIVMARYFAEQIVPPALALVAPIKAGGELLYALSPEQLAG